MVVGVYELNMYVLNVGNVKNYQSEQKINGFHSMITNPGQNRRCSRCGCPMFIEYDKIMGCWSFYCMNCNLTFFD